VGRAKKVTTGRPFEVWPTDYKIVTQHFGDNPQNYIKWGFPGHEGIDIVCYLGEPYYCVLPGTVIWASKMRRSGGESAYGYHVIVDHGVGLTTLYAHAMEELPVKIGDKLEAGDIVAYSGNTGNSFGAHLHLTVKKEGYILPGWPPGYMNPWLFLQHFEGVINGG
jgi:murein DD-endopeptidase MepM/ murein hydrolase activator NlpD